MSLTVAMLVPHEPKKDPRIHWEASLASREFDVVVLGLQENPEKYQDEENIDNYRIIREMWAKKTDSRLHYLLYLIKFLIHPSLAKLLLPPAAILFPFIFIFEFIFLFIRRIIELIFGAIHSFLKSVFNDMATYRVLSRFLSRRYKKDKKPIKNKLLKSMIAKANCFILIHKRLFHTTMALLRAYSRSGINADLIHCNDLDTLLAGIILKERSGRKLVYDAHELWPVSFSDMPEFLMKFLKFYEKRLIRFSDAAFTVSPDLASIMQKWYSFNNVESLPNAEIYTDDRKILNTGLRNLAGNRLIFLYQGGFAKDRGLEELISAWHSVDGEKAVLCLRGVYWPYVEELKKIAGNMIDCGRVYFLPPVNEEDLVVASREADIGIIPYRPVSFNNKYCCPNKFSQYLHAGLAILTNNLPYLKTLLEKFNCGLDYDSDNQSTLLSAINRFISDRELLDTFRKNAILAARESFNWNILGMSLINSYKKLLSSKLERLEPKEDLRDFCISPFEWLKWHYKSTSLSHLETHRKENPCVISITELLRIRNEIEKRFPESSKKTISRAEEICDHKFTVLGTGPYHFGNSIDWSSDLKGQTWLKGTFTQLRELIYDNFPQNEYIIGDIKIPWDFNKHLHFFDIARAYVITGDEKYPAEFRSQIESWWSQNPFTMNLAWMEPLIVAQRAISWVFAMRFLIHSPAIDDNFFNRFMASMYNHMQWIKKNYELEEKSTNHLIGNIAGVIVISAFFPQFDISEKYEKKALEMLTDQLEKQIHLDGVQYEQSVSYHRYVLEFLLSIVLFLQYSKRRIPETLMEKIEKMAIYLMFVISPSGTANLISDADGACVFRFTTQDINDYRPHLALCAALFNNRNLAFQAKDNTEILIWTLNPDNTNFPIPAEPAEKSKLFRDGGMVTMRNEWSGQANLLTFDCGNIGMGYTDEMPHGTHGHDDLLSITISSYGKQMLVDSGSGSYTGNLLLHESLRLSMHHNTLSLSPPFSDKSEAEKNKPESHSIPLGPWVLEKRANPGDVLFLTGRGMEFASCHHNGYRRFPEIPVVKRSIFFFPPDIFIVLDHIKSNFSNPSTIPQQYFVVLLPFHFHPDAKVEYDRKSNCGMAFRDTSCLKYAITSNNGRWKSELFKGSREPYKGWFAVDYGYCIPSPTIEYECVTSLPYINGIIFRCQNKTSVDALNIRWLASENGDDADALAAESGRERFYIGLNSKGLSSIPFKISLSENDPPDALTVVRTDPDKAEKKAWIISGKKIREMIL